jgi:hypothetical protein
LSQKRPISPSEVPPSKKVKKTFTEELLKEVSKFMATQSVMKQVVKAKPKKMLVKPNVRLQNWKTAMRRNFQPGQKALLPFTIRRAQLHTVSALSCLLESYVIVTTPCIHKHRHTMW